MNVTTDQLFESLIFENAPEASKPLLEKAKTNMGFIPNLVAKMSKTSSIASQCDHRIDPAARRAGTTDDRSAATMSNPAATANMTGSPGFTPKS